MGYLTLLLNHTFDYKADKCPICDAFILLVIISRMVKKVVTPWTEADEERIGVVFVFFEDMGSVQVDEREFMAAFAHAPCSLSHTAAFTLVVRPFQTGKAEFPPLRTVVGILNQLPPFTLQLLKSSKSLKQEAFLSVREITKEVVIASAASDAARAKHSVLLSDAPQNVHP